MVVHVKISMGFSFSDSDMQSKTQIKWFVDGSNISNIYWNVKRQHSKLKLPSLNFALSVIGCCLVGQWIQVPGGIWWKFISNSNAFSLYVHTAEPAVLGRRSNFKFNMCNCAMVQLCNWEIPIYFNFTAAAAIDVTFWLWRFCL